MASPATSGPAEPNTAPRSQHKKHACDTCHRRKVKCDGQDERPCRNCQIGNVECTFFILHQRLKKMGSTRRDSLQGRRHHPLQARASPASAENIRHLQTSPQNPTPPQPQPQPQPQLYVESSPKHSLILNEKDIVEEDLARTALTEFLHRGFQAPTWSVFHERDPIRIAYVGTSTSNLAYLVGQESPYHGDASLHFSFPSIRPALPWKPSNDLPLVKWYSNMVQDVSLLPEKEVCDQLVEDFFTKIHPGFPVVDEAEFRLQYNNDKNPVPLLLFQSVLLAGSHVCQHPKVAKSRSLVKVALFRRAKALFDLHYENNREHLIQAALLFTWHFEGADDIGANAYYWIGVACRLAFGLGLHRNLSSSARSVIPVQDRRIQRRLFWVIFQYDVLASLHHGRPLMINDDDCDQPPLVIEDFIEIDGQLNRKVYFDYCDQSIKLCHIIISVIKLFSPGSLRRHRSGTQTIESSRLALDSQLEGWFLRLPPNLNNPSRHPQDFWCTQLHLHYNIALLQLYRTSHVPTSVDAPNLSLAPSSKSIEICHNAASSISQLFSSLLVSSNIDRCCFTALTMLLAAAIQMSLEARSASSSGSQILGLQAQSRLENLFPVMNEVAKYWPSAEAIYRLFRDVLNNMKAEMERNLAASDLLTMREQGTPVSQAEHSLSNNFQGHSSDNQLQIGLSDQDWNGLLGPWDASAFFDGSLNGMNV